MIQEGDRFDRLVTIAFFRDVTCQPNALWWECVCDCGKTHWCLQSNLRSGGTKSCGCLHKEQSSKRLLKHNMSNRPEYQAWACMKDRCYNRKSRDYRNWGGRGIRVYIEWYRSFEWFYHDMGPRPDGCSLERVNNEGHYNPGNCKWATRLEQSRNRRNMRSITYNGVTQLLVDWSKETGLSVPAMTWRINQGLTPEQVLRPLGVFRK